MSSFKNIIIMQCYFQMLCIALHVIQSPLGHKHLNALLGVRYGTDPGCSRSGQDPVVCSNPKFKHQNISCMGDIVVCGIGIGRYTEP